MENNQRQGRIRVVMTATGCDEKTAIANLEAEEWDCIDAVRSINGKSTIRSRRNESQESPERAAAAIIAEMEIEHINTGCRYETDGQLITIARYCGQTHFIDHSRMIAGTINKPTDARGVCYAYLHNLHESCTLDTWVRAALEKFYHQKGLFRDFRREYNSLQYIL